MIFNRYLNSSMKLVHLIFYENLFKQNFHSNRRSFQRISRLFVRYSSIIQFKLGDIGEGIRDVELKEWYVEIGDRVKEFDKICEVQSDKANFTITSRYAGTVVKLYHTVNGTATVGKPLVDIQLPPGIELPFKKKKTTIKPEDILNKSSLGNLLATPAVRQLAKELRISLNEIQGSGKDGRILTQDLIDFRAQKTISNKFSAFIAPRSPTSVKQTNVPRSLLVSSSLNSISNSHLTFFDQYNLTKLIQLRQQSYLAFIIKACSQICSRYSILNTFIQSNSQNKSHQIAITIPTDNQFVLGHIQNIEQLSILHIEHELIRLEQLAKTNQLTNTDLLQSTFLLVNFGQIGGTYSIPFVHSSRLVIGSLGKITKYAVPNDDEECDSYDIHSMLSVTWSIDNRVIDGRIIVKFSNQLKFLLENPYEILLN